MRRGKGKGNGRGVGGGERGVGLGRGFAGDRGWFFLATMLFFTMSSAVSCYSSSLYMGLQFLPGYTYWVTGLFRFSPVVVSVCDRFLFF